MLKIDITSRALPLQRRVWLSATGGLLVLALRAVCPPWGRMMRLGGLASVAGAPCHRLEQIPVLKWPHARAVRFQLRSRPSD